MQTLRSFYRRELLLVLLFGALALFATFNPASAQGTPCTALDPALIRFVVVSVTGDDLTPYVASNIAGNEFFNPEAVSQFTSWHYDPAQGWTDAWSNPDVDAPPTARPVATVSVLVSGDYSSTDGFTNFADRQNWKSWYYGSDRSPSEGFNAWFNATDGDGHPDCWYSASLADLYEFIALTSASAVAEPDPGAPPYFSRFLTDRPLQAEWWARHDAEYQASYQCQLADLYPDSMEQALKCSYAEHELEVAEGLYQAAVASQ